MERKKIKNRVLQDRNVRIYRALQFPLFCILLVIGFLGGFGIGIGYIDSISDAGNNVIGLLISMGICFIYTPLLMIIFGRFLNRPFEVLDKLLDIGDSLSEKVLGNNRKVLTIDEVLAISGEIYGNNAQLAYMRKIWGFFLRKTTNKFLLNFFAEKQNEILTILISCKSDLQIRMKEYMDAITIQKNEITSKMRGSTEFSTTGEAQKVRLDSQIEQFEELQKVLVKI